MSVRVPTFDGPGSTHALWARLVDTLRREARALRRRLPLPGYLLAIGDRSRGKTMPVAALPGVQSFAADTGGQARRTPFKIVDAPPALAAEMAARETTPIVPPAARLAVLDHAVVRDGIVETADGTIAAESLINRTADDPIARTGSIAIMRRLSGRSHVMLKQRWDANYGHWLVEGLPRLALVEERFNLADLDYIVSAHHGRAMGEVYEDSLALFGIRRDQIVEIGEEPVAVDRLIYPSPMTEHPWHIAPRCVSVLEQLAARVRAHPCGRPRVYVSRNKASRRRLLNEAELLPMLRQHGFLVVEPEFLTLYQQIGLFRNARTVVGNLGAALTNVAFAEGSPTLFTLTSPFMQDDFFSTLMSLKRGRYLSLHGDAVGPAPDMNSDFRIDPDRFRALLADIV